MTNSYNLSPTSKHRLLIIHGLNNNANAFAPMGKALSEQGFDVHYVTLPCHGEIRDEATDLNSALECFDQTMRSLINGPYSVVAFSQGALYLQLWMTREDIPLPVAQVLLAPALFIKNQRLIGLIADLLPSFLSLPSFSPVYIRKYSSLFVREYRLLVAGLRSFKNAFRAKTLLIIDPEDELVHAGQIQRKLGSLCEIELIHRRGLKRGPGHHHIIFHPDFYSPGTWEKLIERMASFLKISV
jgi:hypothetical protein